MRKALFIFILCFCILTLSSCSLSADNNISELDINCIHSGFIKYDKKDIDTDSFWIIRDLEEWSKNRHKYIPTVNLVPAIDYGTFDFDKYDLVLLKYGIHRDDKLLYGFEVEEMVLEENTLNITVKQNSVAITNNKKEYIESFSILKVEKGILPIDLEIKTIHLDDKSYTEGKQNDNIISLFTGFIDDWSLYREQGVERKGYGFNNEEEWIQFKNRYIADINIPNVDFEEYFILLYEDFHGAKPTLSSAFRIVDVYVEKDTLNIVCEDISTYINFESHLGLAIAKVKKEYVKNYKKINIRYVKD